MDNVSRNLDNFSRIPIWNCLFNKEELEKLLDITGSWIVCNGKIRDLVIDKLTEDRFKVSTKEKVYA